MKTFLKILAFAAIAITLLIGLKLIVQYETTLPIEGTITDATTGRPIENVVVTAVWHFSRPGAFDSSSWTKRQRTVTDEEGRFQIPSKRTNNIISTFNYQTTFFHHPLYENKEQYIYVRRENKYRSGSVTGQKVVVHIPLLSLEERYSRPEDNSDLATCFSTINPDFYLHLRDKYGVRYDLEAILEKWNYLANRYPEGTEGHGYYWSQKRIREINFKMKELLKIY